MIHLARKFVPGALLVVGAFVLSGAEVQCGSAGARPSLSDLQAQIDEIRSDELWVFDVNGRDEKRIMSAEMLRDNRVTHEGQSLRVRIQKLEREGRIDTVTCVEPLGDSAQLVHEDLWPDLDTTKFQRMG